MTDQGWNVNGGAGGAAEGAGGDAKEPSPAHVQNGGDGGAANVVPFPGNWFGSVDELVPLTSELSSTTAKPGAERPAAGPATVRPAAAPRRSAAPVPTEPDPKRPRPARDGQRPSRERSSEGPVPAAADASSFWDGEATTLQGLVATSAGLDVGGDDSLRDRSGSASRAAVRRLRRLPGPGAASRAGTAGHQPRSLSSLMLALSIIVIAGGGALVVAGLRSGRRPHVTGNSGKAAAQGVGTTTTKEHKRVLTQTVTRPAVTVTRTVATRAKARGSRRRAHSPGRAISARRSGTAASRTASPGTSQASTDSSTAPSSGTALSATNPTGAGGAPAAASSGSQQSTSRTAASPPAVYRPPAKSSQRSRGSRAACPQSPDSGCLP